MTARPQSIQMFVTFAIAAGIAGAFAGVFAGRDGTRFFVGLGYAFALVAAAAIVILVSTALLLGDSFVLPISSAAFLFGAIVLPFAAIMLVGYSAAFAVARRLKSRRAD